MGKHYSQLSLHERQRLFNWFHYHSVPIREIARRLRRSHSTILREIQRNKTHPDRPYYYPHPANRTSEWRKRRANTHPRLKTPETREFVIEKLKLGWTPELISGHLKHHSSLKYVCHESIYQFIYKEAPELREFLARKHKRRRKKHPYRKPSEKTLNKISILDRPEAINNRSEVGHWESDSVESKGRNTGLNVLIERRTRLVKITKLASKKAAATTFAIKKALIGLPSKMVKSITYDNGVENAEHLLINEALACDSYFCQPYHSWEKGAVEQVNGLIRRYYPKGTDFNDVSEEDLQAVEDALNNRPRKCLGFKTPLEVYNKWAGALGD